MEDSSMCPKWPGNSDIPSPHVWHLKFWLMVLKKAHDIPAQLLLSVVVWSSFHDVQSIHKQTAEDQRSLQLAYRFAITCNSQ